MAFLHLIFGKPAPHLIPPAAPVLHAVPATPVAHAPNQLIVGQIPIAATGGLGNGRKIIMEPPNYGYPRRIMPLSVHPTPPKPAPPAPTGIIANITAAANPRSLAVARTAAPPHLTAASAPTIVKPAVAVVSMPPPPPPMGALRASLVAALHRVFPGSKLNAFDTPDGGFQVHVPLPHDPRGLFMNTLVNSRSAIFAPQAHYLSYYYTARSGTLASTSLPYHPYTAMPGITGTGIVVESSSTSWGNVAEHLVFCLTPHRLVLADVNGPATIKDV